MKTLVIYDSVFGNTEQIAQAIGKALADPEVLVLPVSQVRPEQLSGLKLLVVGSPTRSFRPTEAITRFLKGLPSANLEGVRVAAFDTRIVVAEARSALLSFFVRLYGPAAYAAKYIADRLTRSGARLLLPPEGFFVQGTEGPLKEGELRRAADWARRLQTAP